MRKSVFTALFFLTTSLPLHAQELPSAEDLQSRLTTALPGFWDIAEFRVIASALQGDPIDPQALVRFEADVAPASDLFSVTGETTGPFTIVVPTYDMEHPRTLFGTMQLDYKAGQWSGEPNIENPVRNLGQPRDMFTDPTLVLGSEEQGAMLATLRDDTVAAAKARLDAEIAALQVERDQRTAELEAKFLEQANDLAANHKATAAGHAEEVATLEADYEARVVELKETYDPQVSAEEKRLAGEITRLRAAHGEAVDTLNEQQAAEIEELQMAHAKRVGELKAQQAQIVAELEAGFSAKKERLERQLTEAEAILVVQAKTIAAMETAAGNDTYMKELIAQTKERNLEFFKSFGPSMTGSLHCESQNTDNVVSWPIMFNVAEATGTGLSGEVSVGKADQSFPATLTLASASIDRPVKLSFAAAIGNVVSAFDVVLADNGSMRGERSGQMLFGSYGYAGDCTLTLGAS